MKTWIRSALASCMLVSTFSLCAEDTAAPKPDAAKAAVEKPHAKPEGEKLTPEQRKEAREKAHARHKDLQAKKDAGTLTDPEKKELARLEKRGKGGKDAGPRKHKKQDEQPK